MKGVGIFHQRDITTLFARLQYMEYVRKQDKPNAEKSM